MTKPVVHLDVGSVFAQFATTACGVTAERGQSGDNGDMPTTCQACIDAYETKPQPVTTTDLLAVVEAIWALRCDLALKAVIKAEPHALRELRSRLRRPRKLNP